MPVLARVYHVPPREQHRLTLTEFRGIQQDYIDQQQRAEEVT